MTARRARTRRAAGAALAAIPLAACLSAPFPESELEEALPEGPIVFERRGPGPLIFGSQRGGVPGLRVEMPCRHEFESEAGKGYEVHYAYCIGENGEAGESGLGIFVGADPETFRSRDPLIVNKDRRRHGAREILWYGWEDEDVLGNRVLMRETVLDEFFEEFFEARRVEAPRKVRKLELHIWVYGTTPDDVEALMGAAGTLTAVMPSEEPPPTPAETGEDG